MPKLIRLFSRLLPSSLTNRVFALYSLTLLVFVISGLILFLKFHFQLQIDQSEEASVMVVEVAALAVQDSVIIGDYDTVRKTLGKGVQGSVFESAAFIDLTGGVVEVKRHPSLISRPPEFINRWVIDRLQDVNRTITVGGKDYGVLRLRFDTHTVAQNLWSLTLLVLSVGIISLFGGLFVIRFLLIRWLGGLDRLRTMVETLGTAESNVVELDTTNEPSEIKTLVDIFNKTAHLVQEREATRRALDDQKFALDQHAIVSITDLNGDIIYANDRFCEITEYTRADLMGKNHRMIGSGTHPATFFENLWKTIITGKVWHGEICNQKRSGALYWVNATIVPLLDEHGRPQQFIAIRTDISDSKNAQHLILQAKEAAEAANRVKSDFLANMSHEIRTPMNGIIGMTELALDTDLNAEQREYVNLVKVSANSLLQIVNDILDFSKIEAGKMEIERISFSLDETLNTVLKTLSSRAHQRRLELLLSMDPNLPDSVIGDPGRLQQVLMNLLGNAIKFTESGEVTLSVKRADKHTNMQEHQGPHQLDENTLTIYFEVTDTGIGIPHEKFDLIFHAFSQADTSTTRQYGGTGLGLSISAQLVNLMGGQIGLESELNRGSKFFFTIDFIVDQDAPSPSQSVTELLSGTRALIVDDNAQSRNILQQIFETWQVPATIVANGNDALIAFTDAWSQQTPFNLALIDAQMPFMDGFELAKKLSRKTSMPCKKIIMLTTDRHGEDLAHVEDFDIAAFLFKPLSRAHLLDQILSVQGRVNPYRTCPIESHKFRKNKRGLHLLVAEDNVVNQTLLLHLLQKLGHTATLTQNGIEAIAQFQAHQFDAILMDVDMPMMNGYEATRQIRMLESSSQENSRPIPILAITAHAMEGTQELCLRNGMDAYLSKPIDIDALWQKLDAIQVDAGDNLLNTAIENSKSQTLNLNKMREMIDNDKELFHELCRLFSLDVEKHLNAIRAGIQTQDSKLIKQGAHSIKGMVGVFFDENSKQAAAELERNTDPDQANLLLIQLQESIMRLQSAIAEYRW